jgi:hypothetical protein
MATVTFSNDIVPLFRRKDIECMEQFGVLLDNYAFMSSQEGDLKYSNHANARHVHARLLGVEAPRMPQGGPYWPPAQLELFEQWMKLGFSP